MTEEEEGTKEPQRGREEEVKAARLRGGTGLVSVVSSHKRGDGRRQRTRGRAREQERRERSKWSMTDRGKTFIRRREILVKKFCSVGKMPRPSGGHLKWAQRARCTTQTRRALVPLV